MSLTLSLSIRRTASLFSSLAALLLATPLLAETETQTTLTQSSATSQPGEVVTLTATVTAPGGATPTGNVSFRDGGVEIGLAALSAMGIGVADVSAGHTHSCALASNGRVFCWGWGGGGRLGNGEEDNSSVPVPVSGISDAVAVAAGIAHNCAVLETGAVQCWGGGRYGRLGNGANTRSSVPLTVSGISDAVSVSAGDQNSCAVLGTGALRCWGWGDSGQLGSGATDDSSVPIDVAPIGEAQLTTTTLMPGTRSLTAHFPGEGGLAASTSAPLMHEVATLDVAFTGGGVVFGQTAQCGPVLGSAPQGVTVSYSPAELGGLPSGVSITWPDGSEHLALWGTMASGGDFFGGAGRGTWTRFVFYPTRPLIRVVSRRVTAPDSCPIAGADELVLRLRVQNFAATPGCAVTVAATLRRDGPPAGGCEPV